MKRFIFYLVILTAWSLYFFFDIHKVGAETHKGATYPLETFSDPELEKELKEFEERDPDKWGGYLEFLAKPGTDRSLGQADLFAPFYQDKNDLFFFNVRGQLDDQDTHEYNFGIGHRHLFDKFILGSYVFHDQRNTEFDKNFTQKTFGVEALSESFDFRINGYLPESNEQVVSRSIPTESLTVSYTAQKALAGYDTEIGYRLPLNGFLDDTRIYAGGYHYLSSGSVKGLSGPRLRLETRVHDLPFLGYGSRLMVGVESQYDEQRGSQTFGLAQVRIPFHSIFEKIRPGKPSARPVLTKLERRMLEPVVRDVDIVTGKTTREVPVLNLEGKPYTQIMNVDTSLTMAEIEEKVKIETDKGELPLLIHSADSNNTPIKITNTYDVPGGFTWAIAGTPILIKSTNPFSGETNFLNMQTAGKAPEWVFPFQRDDDNVFVSAQTAHKWFERPIFVMADKAHINGWNIDGNKAMGEQWNEGSLETHPESVSWIFNNINRKGDFFISNSHFKNSSYSAIRLEGGGTLNIFNGSFTDSGWAGIEAIGRDVENKRTTINIHGSYIANNKAHGLSAKNGGKITGKNLLIENNIDVGVDSHGRLAFGSHVEIFDSIIRGNDTNVYVNHRSKKVPDNDVNFVRIVRSKIYNAKGDNVVNNRGKLIIEDSHLWGAGLTVPRSDNVYNYGVKGEEGSTYSPITIIRNSILDGRTAIASGGYNIRLRGGKGYFENVDFVNTTKFIVHKKDFKLKSFFSDSILIINGKEYEPDVIHTKLK